MPGEIADELTNPFTNKPMTVKHLRSGPVATTHAPGQLLQNGQPLPIKHKVGVVQILGDTIWISHDLSASFPGPGGRLMSFYDYVKYQAKLADMENTALDNVPATFAIQDYIDWRPWMGMDGSPGMMPGRGVGVKLSGVDGVPAQLLGWIKDRDPKFLSDPEAWKGDSLI